MSFTIPIISGLIGGFDIFGSSAFGKKNYRLLGLYLHRISLISYLLISIFVTFHYFFALDIIGLLKKDKIIMNNIAKYLHIFLINSILSVQLGLNFRYLSVIEKSHINLIFNLITLSLHSLWCYILIMRSNLGIIGIGLSSTISLSVNVILSTFYIYIIKPLPESIFMYCRQSFYGWWSILKISIPSAFILCAEIWAWEILAVMASSLTKEDFTLNIFTVNIALNTGVITTGFSVALAIVVGREFGKGNIKSSQNYFKIFAFMSISLNFLVAFLLFFFRKNIFKILSDETKYSEKSEKILMLLSIYLIFHLVQNLLTSFFRGIGKLLYSTIITFSNFYIFQVGVGFILTKIYDFEIYGIWLAILISSVTCSFINLIVYLNLDLEKELYITQKRLSNDNKIAN
jgi:MATE family multidrug resistance protein